jgi:ATP-dependent helicase IRC3
VSLDKFQKGLTRQLIALPTGTGKTPLFASLKRHHGFDKRMLVLVHREELADQAAKQIQKWNEGITVGVEMGDRHAGSHCDVVVASVQSIGRANSPRLTQFNPETFSCIVCDEAHHSIAPSYKTVFDHFGLRGDEGRGRLLLGVTATPNRGDGQGLGQVYDEIIYQMSILDAIRAGWLVDLRGVRIKSSVDLNGVAVRAGDFSVGDLEAAVNIESRNHLIVQSWLKHGQGRQTIAFTVDIAHAQRLADTFKAYGVSCEAIWGTDPNRAEKLAFHKAKKLTVLTNCGVLTEGYDDWQVACIVMARPTKSQLLFVQMAGRGTRIPEGLNNLIEARNAGIVPVKEDCLLIDVVDNTTKHSLVTLASIFGLAPKVDVGGKKITEAIAQFQKAVDEHPSADFSEVESLEDIDSQVERAELFAIKWPEEVTENSQLRWMKTPAGEYTISLPSKETVTVYKDLLDKWSIKGSVNGNSFSQEGINELPEAFRVADNLVTTFGRELLTLLRRDARWHKQKITAPQLNLLRKLFNKNPEMLAKLGTLSKGEASKLIGQTLHKQWKVAPPKEVIEPPKVTL